MLKTGATSWTRSGPADDVTSVTAAQLRDVVDRLSVVGQWQPGEPGILIVIDVGYDIPAWPGPARSPGRWSG
ncbi:hypothetical protein [Streptomyces sp. NPDC014623]|uniref:hypothetical protein n=1 Tax=Streptomyces sp. NPDC014623 TaxID=3364875 RepID=UPI0036F63F2E